MTHLPRPPETAPPAKADVPPRLILLMAAGTGFSVASIYYNQPLLGMLGPDLGVDAATAGLVPTMAQLGYAIGILFFLPLGDRFDRRDIILVKAAMLALALFLSGLTTDIGGLLCASLVTGIVATMAQDIVPGAATLAPDAQRGKVVGSVMTGLLLGILLSRVFSGLIAEFFGWRVVYTLAAASVLAIAAGLWRGLPRFMPTTQLPYGRLLASLFGLWREYGALRRAALAQGLLSMGFSAFWSTLAIMLKAHYDMGAGQAGLFGLAGAAGAVSAALAGRLADRRGPELVSRLGCGLSALSFAAMGLLPVLSPAQQIVVIAISAVGFDFGIQAGLVAHQTIVYGIDPGARSRLNSVLFTNMFIGMALGSALGSVILLRWDWGGVVGFATATAFGALLVRLATKSRRT